MIGILLFVPAQAAPFAAIVIDARTGETLYEKNADARLNPASLTKMMTLYITFQEIEAGRLSLDSKITVSKHAAGQPPSRLGLKPGQKIALRYLIRAAAVKSANDAATTIGEAIGGTEAAFAKRMTRTAKQLGMTNTTFRNANGLTAEGHLSSARDMTTLGRHLFYDFPQYYNIFSRRTADAGVAEVRNTNSRFLDAYEGADGIKTGYTGAAGFNLTASAQRGNKRIIATVFGGASTAARNAKMIELMDLGFGIAKNRVDEQKPVAPEAPTDALIASAEPEIDVPDAEGGSAKTLRISGAVSVSPRPKPRPSTPQVPDDIAIAMAESIEGALAEATAESAPEGTLDFQAEAIAAAPTDAETDAAVALALAEAPTEAPAGTLDAQAIALADDTLPEMPAEEATLDAEAVAVAEGTLPETGSDGTLDAQALVIADATPTDPLEDSPLAALKPPARPEDLPNNSPADAPVELAVAEPQPTPELVMTDAGEPLAEDIALADTTDALPEVTDVETVAGAANATPPPTELATAMITTPRKAPIFDSAEPALEEPAAEDQEVVVVMSTSGGRHFGVNVGNFPSRYDAERALLKTALAESATLNDGLRKISQKDGTWHANFMGLTEDQADLACRRLHARAIPCETLSP
ncbi:serine hydrolase [Tabrizicola sp.]|uniref:serine hydrolase n=1 Tax=Tabrizicola sp. TaxID=2005166 RepID=UPI00286C4980|nr:serine hydrolase [Tabrizicola sp.]